MEKEEKSGQSCYVYIVECADGSYYTGWTTDVAKREKAHNDGKGARYTKSRRPVHVIYTEQYFTKQEAMQREWAIKQYTRKEKEALIAGQNDQKKTRDGCS